MACVRNARTGRTLYLGSGSRWAIFLTWTLFLGLDGIRPVVHPTAHLCARVVGLFAQVVDLCAWLPTVDEKFSYPGSR